MNVMLMIGGIMVLGIALVVCSCIIVGSRSEREYKCKSKDKVYF